MDAFDALPAIVRMAIARADFPFHPETASRLLDRGIPAERVAATITGADKRLSGRGVQ